MFDRFINVLTIFIIVLSIGVLGGSLYDEYTRVGYRYNISDAKPWERYNESMVIDDKVASAKKVQSAISNAREAGEKKDAEQLIRYYERSYKSDGARRTRFNSMDWKSPFLYAGLSILFLIIPLTVNYVRHGRPKLWNATTPNKSSKRTPKNGAAS